MKFFRAAVCALLAAIMISGSVTALAANAKTESVQLTREDALTAFGTLLKTKSGETITLRGTNLGGWLIQEEWMCGFTGANAQLPMINKLVARFGEEKAQELMDAYEDNFITEYDLDYIEDLGFNCVRVPFWYRNLQSDDNGTWRRDENGNIDFSRLDWVVEECGKRGIYVILDMHGLPGFQSIAHHSGMVDASVLYDETPEGERARELSVELWTEVAKHFNGNPIVAAYDLMNEPMCDFSDERKDDNVLAETYDMLYDAVRSVDKEHIVIFEGVWRFWNLPDPQKYGWKNIMYELHLYNAATSDFENAVSESRRELYGVPIYIGEFKPTDSTAPWSEVLSCFNKNLCSWTTWTYKGHCKWGDSSDWFILGVSGNDSVADLDNDSFETIKTKWSNVKTQNGYREMGEIETLKEYAAQPVKAGALDIAETVFTAVFGVIKRVFFLIAGLFN